MRPIDADALMEKLKQHHDFFVEAWGGFKEMPLSDKVRCDELSNSIAEILNAPTIDVNSPQGEWIVNTSNYESICSICGAKETEFIYGTEMWYGLGESKFCPSCGRRMKGVDNDNA